MDNIEDRCTDDELRFLLWSVLTQLRGTEQDERIQADIEKVLQRRRSQCD